MASIVSSFRSRDTNKWDWNLYAKLSFFEKASSWVTIQIKITKCSVEQLLHLKQTYFHQTVSGVSLSTSKRQKAFVKREGDPLLLFHLSPQQACVHLVGAAQNFLRPVQEAKV